MEYFDIVIVGAGLSGIGTAYHLQDKCPHKSYVILEAREALGGTWDLFRYPGVRSDSDMHTLGYTFKPWTAAKVIADGPSILEYVRETAVENGIDQKIRYGHRVTTAHWSTDEASWTVETELASGGTSQIRCNVLLMCSGYYSYESGYKPEFAGVERFQGQIVHPQEWPEDLDYKGKKVVVIGSGATAVTLVPAMADDTAHITMLQRSPTYMAVGPDEDAIANRLRRILPEKLAYKIVRWKNVNYQQLIYKKLRAEPEKMKEFLVSAVQNELVDGYDVDTHFTPFYKPWDQRLCLVPNSDLFEAINEGKASVVTDHIDTFTEKGICLKSGQELEADIIVTATGLNLLNLGGAELVVDGEPVDYAEKFTYKGMMCSNVPNLIVTFGYVNASWTLRSDLIAEFTCRTLKHMDKIGVRQVTPRLRKEDEGMKKRPFILDFSANYMQRAMPLLPKQGDREPWLNSQNYGQDKKMLRRGKLEDGVLIFDNPSQ